MAKQWKKTILELNPKHTWKRKPGYNIFAADRGAIRLNFPQNWVVKPAEDCIKFHDAEPPNDTCVLAVSYLRLPPDVDWRKLPLARLLNVATVGDRRKLQQTSKVIEHPRDDLEVMWKEYAFMDPEEKREAISYIALARGFNLQCLLTFDYWPQDRARLHPVWEEALRSLQLGLTIKDPATGEVLH